MALVVLGAGIFFYRYTSYLHENAQAPVQAKIAALVESYQGSVWERYAPVIAGAANSPYRPNFEQETTNFFKPHGLASVTIYAAESAGNVAYCCSTQPPITRDGVNRLSPIDFSTAQSGKPVAHFIQETHLKPGDAARGLWQVLVPLRHSSASITQAVAEIYFDPTLQVGYGFLAHLPWVVGVLLLLLLTLGGSLFVAVQKAEVLVSKQHEANLELIAAVAQAEAQSQDKSQFLASVSHELRTPLNAIIGFSDIIRNEVREQLPKAHQEYLDDINASGKHLLSLINDILDFSKAEAGKLQIEWAETDATKIIRNSLRMVLPRAETAQVTLVEDVPGQHLVIVTDAKKLKQVLLNLLSNAVKFTPAGGEVRCHAWVDVVSGALTIEVRDTGIGIAPKDISRVMTPFGQVDSALSRKYEGTGLGLPLSKKFIESMGGKFTIES